MEGGIIEIDAMIVKIASRCNIDCKYCFMYNKGDTTFKSQPKFMSKEIINALMPKIRMHCFLTGKTEFQFTLHGGEPLLASKELILYFMDEANKILIPDVTPKFIIQTNGILIDEEWCDIFAKYKVVVGISLDGPKDVNDKNRVSFQGESTYDASIAGLHKVQNSKNCQNAGVIPSILSVIDTESNPKEVYQHIKDLKVRYFKPLIPANNYEDLPIGIESQQLSNWLIELFDIWFNDKDSLKPDIPILSDIIRNIIGISTTTEYLGQDDLGLLILETDGGLEPGDILKICGEGFTKVGVNILTDEINKVQESSLISLYNQSKNTLCKQCTDCPINSICGGGFLPHRFKKSNRFDNPSVYCTDLMRLIIHIQNNVIALLPEDLIKSEGIISLNYDEIYDQVNS